MSRVVIVIDMTRAFLERGHALYCGDKARLIIPNVQKLLSDAVAREDKILYLNDQHDPGDLEFRVFPPHSIRGSEESHVIHELAAFPGELIGKTRFSAFHRTRLGERLEALKPETIVICGVCTDICVLHTAGDARDRDYHVEVPVDCVASFDEYAHSFGLIHLEKVLGVKLTRAVAQSAGPVFSCT